MKIDILANFVAEPVLESLTFWSDRLNLSASVAFAGFDQIHQTLLLGSIPNTQADWVIILLQLERWHPKPGEPYASLDNRLDSLFANLDAARAVSAAHFMIVTCPPLPAAPSSMFQEADSKLRNYLNRQIGCEHVSSDEILTLYPADEHSSLFDVYADEMACVPYSRLGFATLGTSIVRRIYGVLSPPRKVLVVDCDNTLWAGFCGEIGASDVAIMPDHQRLHEFLVAQAEGGRLVCLCSKNEESAVFAVFARRSEMKICLRHITAWKINWESKAENLRSLSQELNLDLSTFIFVDDDASECGSVRALYPEVLTLHLPQETSTWLEFLRGAWELDLRPGTVEDFFRAAYYQRQTDRNQARSQSASLDEFLAALDLQVEIAPFAALDVARASQLSERTNQFNLNGIRRSNAELANLIRSDDVSGLMVSLRDNFGDYGAVGFVLMRHGIEFLAVETLLLSCRALGKRVEYRMAIAIAEHATVLGYDNVAFSYQPTPRNSLVGEFIKTLLDGPMDAGCAVEATALLKIATRLSACASPS